MPAPHVAIDLARIEHNAKVVVGLCSRAGIEVAGVTKGVCGHPDVARAMLRGGVGAIAESRIDHVRRLRAGGVESPIMLLGLPALSAVDQVVEETDVSLNSELGVLRALGAAARRRDRKHDVLLMVDLGDLREGVWPDDLVPFAREAADIEGIRIVGLGTNLACFSGLAPSAELMARLVALADEIRGTCGIALRWVSGVNSSGLGLIATGRMPAGVNHARIGEAILLGRETVGHTAWPDTFQDAFVLHAEVVELKEKPSSAPGEHGEDAFGKRHDNVNHGRMLRALLNIGREDVLVEGLTPLLPGLRILGGSSGYLVVDVTAAQQSLRVGDQLRFGMSYGALLAAMASGYIEKRIASSTRPAAEV